MDKPVKLSEILSGYIELAQPATTRDLAVLSQAAASDTTREILKGLTNEYAEKVLNRRFSVLDILEEYKDIKLSLGAFLQMLPAMRVRQYSISSSPLWNPQHVTLTISVVEGPALSGLEDEFLGVASNYLANLRPGDRVQIAVRPSNAAFHPPTDPMTPIVLFCAGPCFRLLTVWYWPMIITHRIWICSYAWFHPRACIAEAVWTRRCKGHPVLWLSVSR